MHISALRSTDLKGSVLQHQNMLSQDIRRWSSKIRTWSIEASEALKFSWYHARSSSRSEDKKMLCTKLFDSDIFKRCINKHQIRSKYKMAGYTDLQKER